MPSQPFCHRVVGFDSKPEPRAWVEDKGAKSAASLDMLVAGPVITLSLLERLRSRDNESFSDELRSAMRNPFGGHEIKKE